jgi:hypothetical protein
MEEREGKLWGYEIKANPARKVRVQAKWLKYPDAAFDVITPDKMSGFLLYQVKVSVTIIE